MHVRLPAPAQAPHTRVTTNMLKGVVDRGDDRTPYASARKEPQMTADATDAPAGRAFRLATWNMNHWQTPVERRAEAWEWLGSGGGLHRHLDDSFYGGGRWPLLAGFLGWAHVRARSTGRAWECLDWMAAQAVAGVGLPEQVEDRLLAPDRLDEWLERWGPSATPLLWSHGMYLILADELGVHGQPSHAG